MSSSVIVVKIGGQIATGHVRNLAEVVLRVRQRGQTLVLVHGGGHRITQALAERGLNLPFVDGQRVTTAEAVEVVERVLYLEINPALVTALESMGVAAVGVSGADHILLAAPWNGRTATVQDVDTRPLLSLLDGGLVPVIAPIGVDQAGLHYNMNADFAAAAIAGALVAQRVVFLTDVAGIYEDKDQTRLVRQATGASLRALVDQGCFTGGMVPKVEAIMTALASGAEQAYVIHGEDLAALQWAVGLDGQGNMVAAGTRVTKTTEGIA